MKTKTIYSLPAGEVLDRRLFEAVFKQKPQRPPLRYSEDVGAAFKLLEAALADTLPEGIDDVRWNYTVACDGDPPDYYSCQVSMRSPVEGPTLPLAICYAVASYYDLY